LDKINVYMSLQPELSGSSSKNRFRLEMLWGICKMFDLYDESDFCVVFDYKCDIEVHFNNALEFYQIKTHKIQSPYTFAKISKCDKTGNSILGKLFVLKNLSNDKIKIKVALVSNAFFKLGKTHAHTEVIEFINLDETSRKKIKKALETELNQKNVDISNMYYIYTPMNLLYPEDDVKGKIMGSFEKIKKCEPAKPNTLYRLLRDTVEEKACYELELDDYNDVIAKKGITKSQLDDMLNKYVDRVDIGVEKTKLYIDRNYADIKKRKKLKNALVRIVEASFNAKEIQQKELDISSYLNESINDLPNEYEDIIDVLLKKFSQAFSIEYSIDEIYVFLLLILNRWEDGKYEKNDH